MGRPGTEEMRGRGRENKNGPPRSHCSFYKLRSSTNGVVGVRALPVNLNFARKKKKEDSHRKNTLIWLFENLASMFIRTRDVSRIARGNALKRVYLGVSLVLTASSGRLLCCSRTIASQYPFNMVARQRKLYLSRLPQ